MIQAPPTAAATTTGGWPLAVIVGTFAVLIVTEALLPRAKTARDDGRIATNFALGIGNAALGLALPIGTVAAAMFAAQSGIGLFRHWPVAWSLELVALLTVRSFTSYWVHRASHAIPWLWRVHRVHHADAAVDLSTGLRNHPIEGVIVLAPAVAVVVALGPSISAVIAADTILFIAALWQHAAIALPSRLERLIGGYAMTPRLHLRHHMIERSDHDSNFGDVTIVWDRMFGTATSPAAPGAPVGLAGEADGAGRLGSQIASPFQRRPTLDITP